MIDAWQIEYDRARPLSFLGNLTPEEFVEKHEMERASEPPILLREVV